MTEENESEATEAILRRDLERIVDACLALVPDPDAIVLYGGYGRDEGGWYRDEDGAWRPYNDYDLLLVTDQRITKSTLAPIRTELAREIGIRWIDITPISTSGLRSAIPTIRNYEIKHASRVLHGDPNILGEIPEIRADQLGWIEARIFYFTRLYTFIGSLDHDGLDTTLSGESARFFRNQMAKAVLAVVDLMVLATGDFEPGYRARVTRVLELHPAREDLAELAAWALAEKLRPEAPTMQPAEVRDLYLRVLALFQKEMFVGLGHYFGRDIRGPEDVEFAMRWLPAHLLRRIYWMLKFRSLFKERELAVGFAQAYLASACRADGIYEPHLEKATHWLRFVDSEIPSRLDWNAARLEAARLRMEL